MDTFSKFQEFFLWRLACRVVPEAQSLGEEERQEFFGLIDEALSLIPRRVRAQVGAFLWLIRWSSVLRYGRLWERLPPDRQHEILEWFQNAPIPLLRQGFWGVKTLVFMGYYGRPGVGDNIGYRPSKTGNELLHGG